ncbi:unnamed protein product [Brugia timori]|uniref:Uncharacterized protein n=1 Tax=Brugia timori TaxID=42155 RepID=A0A0R3RA98_9BILA|nr:unnamed protein product [Brugia timori]
MNEELPLFGIELESYPRLPLVLHCSTTTTVVISTTTPSSNSDNISVSTLSKKLLLCKVTK